MKNVFIILLTVLAVLGTSDAGYIVIDADVADLGGGRWKYSYTISNIADEQASVVVSWLTIWFDYADYSNFEITTADALGWSESIIQPEPLTYSGAGYDLGNLSQPLTEGNYLSGFSIAFDYSGAEAPLPAGQKFEIVNPDTWQTAYTGYTVPEPATLALLAIGAIGFRKRK